jgi:hypothetical protein
MKRCWKAGLSSAKAMRDKQVKQWGMLKDCVTALVSSCLMDLSNLKEATYAKWPFQEPAHLCAQDIPCIGSCFKECYIQEAEGKLTTSQTKSFMTMR